MNAESYLTKEYLSKLEQDLQDESIRVKDFVNENGYHNGTAINQIVRKYRTELKKYLEIVREDYSDIT